MLALLQNLARRLLGPPQRYLRWSFSEQHNPLNHLGSLSIFFCWVVLVSGIWLLIFFRTSVTGAFESVQYLATEQWYLGGIMRSLHRYASDALIVTLFLHIVKEFSRNAYRLKRWFSWATGIPLIWMVFLLGVSGYWLVWDELAQYVAITSAELIDRIPVFTDKMAANFLRPSMLSDRFFTLMAFLHLIGLPIFLVFGIWLHVFKLSRPRINPTRKLMAGTLVALLLLAAVFPAPLQDKANLARVPQVVQLDWFYLHFYPLVDRWSPGAVWSLLLGLSGLLFVAPWLPPGKAPAVAVVDLDNCNGCKRCAEDCPYDAVQMAARSDGKRYQQEAVVDPELCVSCGICVGACPTATPFRRKSTLIPGIDLPDRSMRQLRETIDRVTAKPTRVLAFACSDSAELHWLKKNGKACVEVTCAGQLPPSFLDYVLSKGLARRILISGCDGDCRFRFGSRWTEMRLRRERDPHLRRRVGAHRIALASSSDSTSPASIAALWRELDDSISEDGS